MTGGPFAQHDIVLVRARVHLCWASACQLLLPEAGGERLGTFEYPDLFGPPVTDALYFAVQALMSEEERAHDRRTGLGVRVLAELRELGGHAKKTNSS